MLWSSVFLDGFFCDTKVIKTKVQAYSNSIFKYSLGSYVFKSLQYIYKKTRASAKNMLEDFES